ncbi:hypothetical protein [Leifsonia sp. NPDC080035]|uniref:Uncharacterized protein n=1 Tax=Leifsonia sp. NPDC080035 TaxID=3143936 RepID=A0AAU7GEX1_9MICO
MKFGGGATLEFVADGDGHLLGGFSFQRVRAVRTAAESLSDSWHITGAYQELVEIVDSEWVASLKPREIELFHPRHFLIYVEDYGYDELLAADWAWLPAEPGTTP